MEPATLCAIGCTSADKAAKRNPPNDQHDIATISADPESRSPVVSAMKTEVAEPGAAYGLILSNCVQEPLDAEFGL